MPLPAPMDAQGPDSAMVDGCEGDKCPDPRDAIGARAGGAGPAQPPSRGDRAAPPRTRDDGREGGIVTLVERGRARRQRGRPDRHAGRLPASCARKEELRGRQGGQKSRRMLAFTVHDPQPSDPI